MTGEEEILTELKSSRPVVLIADPRRPLFLSTAYIQALMMATQKTHNNRNAFRLASVSNERTTERTTEPAWNSYSMLFSSLPIGAFQWPIASSITLTFNLNYACGK